MTYRHPLLVISILLLHSLVLFAQQPVLTEREIVIELEKRGLDRDEVEEALIERGIDITSLEDVTPEEITIIQDVILEMEKNIGRKKEEKPEEPREKDILFDEEMEQDSIDIEEDMDEEEDEMELPEAELYGQDIFRQNLIRAYTKDQDYSASEDYVLGTGDELALSIWGRSKIDQQHTINKDGYIAVLGGSRRVFLKGITLGKAKEKLRNVLSEYYNFREGEMDLSLNQSRMVRVNIYGEVFIPGPITIPAINNAFNALAESKGPTNIGSVRNIQLIKGNGNKVPLDFYKYMMDPQYSSNLFLDDNDIILVPVANKVVDLQGAVRRPMKYELIDNEGIVDLINYAGGTKENALLKTIRIQRYEDDQRLVTDINYADVVANRSNYILQDGDIVVVDTIQIDSKNFVEVQGEVKNPGIFGKTETMRVSDVLTQAGLTNESRTDVAFIKRRNTDGSIEFEEIDIDNILANRNSAVDIVLRNEDLITIWAKERFTDESNIKIDGAVRYPDEFPYDVSQEIKLKEAIILAGGLRRDASNYGTIYRKDPLNPKIIEYITVTNLKELLANGTGAENLELNPFDSIYVYSDNTFLEESIVSIYGAVNNPGVFQYGKGMTIKDVMVLAGGFKISAATDNVEVSRVQIQDNQPTNVVIAKLQINRGDYSVNGLDGDYLLQPFDKIAVRYVPEFELQESVILKGEVKSPGAYAIVGENEKISSIIDRAGGLTKEAFPEGASLQRAEDDLGAIVVKLNDIFENQDSRFDFIVRGGDTITIPKRREFVTIKGATNVWEVLTGESINTGNEIHVPYHRGKNALFYINHYAGGFNKDANRRSLVVRHPNGEVKRLKRYAFFSSYPEVKEGSVVSVAFKTSEESIQESEEKVDWTRVLGDSVGQAMSILTLLLLINRLN